MKNSGTISAFTDAVYINEGPAYANKIFYSLGFLALTSLAILTVSGVAMAFFGPMWWEKSVWGIFSRSAHLWAAQAFVFVVICHALVVFFTGAYRSPRRLIWVLGSSMFLIAILQTEFGYTLRGDFSSQYRALQGADFYNGAYLGRFLNTLNYGQIYGVHVIVIPIVIFALFFCHYLLVKSRGIAAPYKKDFAYSVAPIDHTKLFLRGGVLAALIVALAALFPAPLVSPAQIDEVANDNPSLMAQTLMQEFDRTSDTATYFDSIDPYTYDTRAAYVTAPYEQYVNAAGVHDELAAFLAESPDAEQANIRDAESYFQNGGDTAMLDPNPDPLIPVVNSLVKMGQSGLYEAAVDAENPDTKPTYTLRFLSDTGVLEQEASDLHITTEEWGMMREEKGVLPPGAWWFAPIGLLNHTVLANDDNGDRDAALTFGLAALLFVFFPFIPYVNRIPEKFHIAELIWKEKKQ